MRGGEIIIYLEFFIDKPVRYKMTGKFKAPSSEWTHMKRQMTDYEFIFVTEGTLYIELDQTQYNLNKGNFLICPYHSNQKGFRNSQCSFYWLHIEGEVSERLERPNTPLRKSKPHSLELPLYGEVYSLEKIIVMMKQLQDAVRCYEDTKLRDYLSTAILCELANQYEMEKTSGNDAIREQIHNDLLDYIKAHLHTNLKVKQIAEYFGYNEKYLSHLFRSIKGMSLKQYILREKIELAKYSLIDTNDNIVQIAEQLGFSDTHHFMKTFKKQVGLTPTEYRNTYGKRLLYYV